CAILAASFALSALGADVPITAGRVFSNVPDVPQPPDDMPAEYRATIAGDAKRYRELYANSQLTEALAEARNGLALAMQAGRPRDEAEFLKATLYVSWLLGETEA